MEGMGSTWWRQLAFAQGFGPASDEPVGSSRLAADMASAGHGLQRRGRPLGVAAFQPPFLVRGNGCSGVNAAAPGGCRSPGNTRAPAFPETSPAITTIRHTDSELTERGASSNMHQLHGGK
jgi:hypothetical protein